MCQIYDLFRNIGPIKMFKCNVYIKTINGMDSSMVECWVLNRGNPRFNPNYAGSRCLYRLLLLILTKDKTGFIMRCSIDAGGAQC